MINYIFDFIKNFEQIKTIFKSTKKFPALLWVFLSTLSFILLFLNMLLSDKIKDMFTFYNIFNAICAIVCVFSGMMAVWKACDDDEHQEQKQEQEEKRKLKIEATLKSLSRGYGGEVAVLKYVLDNPLGSVTWIPFDNAAMVSLNKKGILELVDFPSVTRKSWDKVNTICRLYFIPEYLRSYINAHRAELEEYWGDVLPYAELRHYQHN
ncbi:MAG: hypothetical protein IJQ29_08075 [Synergistaceae bacterium]|nr:hypothetical protein [Synergistaceae bacterium]